MGKLEQMVHVSKTLDAKLEDKANELDYTDPAKAKAIRESALFYVRQRTTDLLTQMAVSVQGYLALDLVKKNNVELIKGVDRASTTTVAALRTAVTVAQALTAQKLVLEQIGALNTTTAKMIDGTGELLRTQTGVIHQQAASSTIPIETLQRAFQNIYATMDAIDTFKVQALASMKTTVDTLGSEVEKSRGYIARSAGQAQLPRARRRRRDHARRSAPSDGRTIPRDARGDARPRERRARPSCRCSRRWRRAFATGGTGRDAARRRRPNAVAKRIGRKAVRMALTIVGGHRRHARLGPASSGRSASARCCC